MLIIDLKCLFFTFTNTGLVDSSMTRYCKYMQVFGVAGLFSDGSFCEYMISPALPVALCC